MRQGRSTRIFGYARVSSVEQALGTSLRDQQAALETYARGLKATVTKFFVESESGIHEKLERREEMRALLATAGPGDLVLCDKIDRWSRDPEFTYRSIRELHAKEARVFFVGDNCDPSTSEGDTMLNFRVLFAREEHKRIKLRMVGTRKILRDQGYYVEGLPPYGYRRAHPRGYKGAEKNVLVLEPSEAEGVRQMFRLCITGHAIASIAESLNLHRDRVADALKCRTYLGQIQNSSGDWIRAKHDPIIDARTFQEAKDALASRTKGSRSPMAGAETSNWWLRDVATCLNCGAKMSAVYAGSKAARRYYFACANRCRTGPHGKNLGSYIPVRWAEEQCDPLVIDRLTELREELAKPLTAPPTAASGSKDRVTKLEAKRARYLDMHADGLSTRDELRAQLAKVDAELMKLEALSVARTAPSTDALRSTLRNVTALERAWRRMVASARRIAIGDLAVRVGLEKDKQPSVTWRSIEDLAAKIA